MPASRSDQSILSAEPTFQNRVRESLVSACGSIAAEGITAALHIPRATQAYTILANPDTYKAIWADIVATDANVISDATAAGTVVLTGGNAAAQAALVTDAHIDTAVSSFFNAFLPLVH